MGQSYRHIRVDIVLELKFVEKNFGLNATDRLISSISHLPSPQSNSTS